MSVSDAAMGTSLKGKRKKKIPPNPNPLFTQWLTEWKHEAVEKGWKSAHVYAKALKTIKLFPLPLSSGKDCRLLQNFGDKICKMLDEKLMEHKHRQGISHTDGTDSTDANSKSDSSASTTNPKTSKRSGLHNISASDVSGSDTENKSSPQKKKSRATGNHGREYVPTYRSGPYALVLTLYRYMQNQEFKGYMTKSELSQSAQLLSDKSFTVPEAGSRYTAWSSMGILIKKGFASKSSSPARYSLTDEGYLLGQRLHGAEMQDSDANVSNQVRRIDSSYVNKLPQGSRGTGNKDVNNLPRFGQLRHSDISSDTDDDDEGGGHLSRAITESLLSYSQERSAKCVSSAFVQSNKVGNQYHSRELHGEAAAIDAGENSGSHIDADDGILVVSDEDVGESHVLPARTWARFHSLSPSQSSPPQYTSLARLPLSEPSLLTEAITLISSSSIRNSSTSLDQIGIHSAAKSPNFNEKSPSACDQDILEISDDEIDKGISKEVENVTRTNSHESDDELPDLDLPLWKRLAQKGHSESGLLKNLTSSLALASSVSQKMVCDTDREISCQQRELRGDSHFSKVKDKPVSYSHQTGTYSSTVIPLTVPCNTSNNYHISNSSNSVHHSSSASVRNTQNVINVDTIGVVPVDVPMEKTAHSSRENSKDMCMPNSSSSYVTTSVTTSVADCCSAFTFLPGSFDIILCLDNREFYGSKGCSKTLLPDLMKSGITCDLRLLHVGDLLWIARERTGHLMERNGRELVLHYIIERKRMDDLVSSMTDGRMKEQKFRLKHCGLSEPIILIEEYGSIQNFSISEDRIKQSIANSQIIDGFKVKRCASAKDAVTYLATMTRFLTQHYSTKTLHAVSLDQLKLVKRQQPLQRQEHYLIPFDVFNEASVKQKDLTVKELFAKQLIQVPGVSADRAKAITSIYPSFSHLMTAYERCAEEKDGQKLLSGIKCGKKERSHKDNLNTVHKLRITGEDLIEFGNCTQ